MKISNCFFSTDGRWLAILFAALYFLFPINVTLSSAALFLIIISALVGFRVGNYWFVFRNTPLLWVSILLYIIILAGSFFASSPPNWRYTHLGKYAKLIYLIVIVLLLSGQEKLQRIALNAFIVAMLFILLSTWLNVWFLLPWSITQDIGWGKTHHVFGDYITQNVMMAFFVVVATHKCINSYIKSHRLFWGGAGVLAVISISHLSVGRTALVLLVAGLLTYTFLATRSKARFGYLFGTLLVLGVAFGTSSLLQDRFNLALLEAQRHDIDNMSSVGHRLYNYKITPNLIAEKPLLGHGTGAYHTEICRFVERKDFCKFFEWHPHNQFLFFAADHGLIGVLLYTLFILGVYRAALKSPNREARLLLCSIASMLLVDSFFNSPLFSSRESQFFMYMIALLLSMTRSPKSNFLRLAK
jgi:O-antigen ligase